MKAFFKNKICTFVLLCFLGSIGENVSAQNHLDKVALEAIIRGANTLGAAYAKPATTALASALASGWSNGAKILAPWQLDIRLGGSMVWIPVADQSFDINSLQLSPNFRYHTTSPYYPTVLGSKRANPDPIEIYDNNNQRLTRIKMPAGIMRNHLPIPQLQLSSGLPYQSAISIRWTPSLTIQNYGKAGMFGLAIQKQLFEKQVHKQRIMSVSILAGYNKIYYNYQLPKDKLLVEDPNVQKSDYLGQGITDRLNVWNIDLLSSYRIPFKSHLVNSCFYFTERSYKPLETYFEPFASLGFQNAYNVLNLQGRYNAKVGYDPNSNAIYSDISSQQLPKNLQSNVLKNVQGTLGLNINIAFVHLYAAYTIGKYSLLNAGLGFKFFAYKVKHDKLTGF